MRVSLLIELIGRVLVIQGTFESALMWGAAHLDSWPDFIRNPWALVLLRLLRSVTPHLIPAIEGQAIMDSVFQQAIAKFEARLTEEQRLQLSGCSRDDVEKTIASIQARWGSERRLRNMNRLSKFLEAMTQLGQVVEVFLNVNSTVAMIWGPIKCLLLIASTWLHGLEKLLETYAEIGESLPPLKEYQRLFKNHHFVLSYLETYYCDILEFHSIAFDVFARPVWKEVFRSSWKTFETRFGPIMNSMRRHKTLLSEEKLTAIQAEIQDFRGNFEDRIAALAKQMKDRDDAQTAHIVEKEYVSRKRKIAAILDKLDPPEYLIDQEYAAEQWQSSDSGAWVLEDLSFREWLKPAGECILYLNGIPGAGKSVLVSRMIHHLQQVRLDSEGNNENGKRQTPAFALVYFYFKHQEPRKRQLADFLAAAAVQLIQQDDNIIDHVFSEYCAGDQSKLRSSGNLLELVQVLVRTQKSCIFVLDGLDECTGNPTENISDECEKVLDAVLSLFATSVSGVETNGSRQTFRLTNSPQRNFRLLVSGQRDGFLDDKFEKYPSIHLEKSSAHSKDIDAYANAIIEKIAKKFLIKQDIISLIFKGIHNESKGQNLPRSRYPKSRLTVMQGMFLYAKIVLNNLLHQVSVKGLKQELCTKSFPKGLHEAYERVVASVFDNPQVAQRDAAIEIIKLVAIAERPLRWREIQAKFCIDLDKEISDPDGLIVDSCKALCRSLVDVVRPEGIRINANDIIHIVHGSALAFLVQTGRITVHIEQARMAMFCGLYLSSCCLQPDSSPATLGQAVRTGYLGLHDYALAFWFEHFAHAIENIAVLSEMDQDSVKKAASKLKNACQRYDSSLSGHEIDVSNVGIQWVQGLDSDHRDRFLSVPAIESMIKNIRTTIETVRTAESIVQGETSLESFYGPTTFNCPKPWCESYFTGFADSHQREQHVQEHERPFRCEEKSCLGYSFGFSTERLLKRHIQHKHSENIDPLFGRTKIGFPSLRPSRQPLGDLCAAAVAGDLARVKELIKDGANLNSSSEALANRSPLSLAAEKGHLEVCQYLLEFGANINLASPEKQVTALIFASLQDDMDLVSLLLDQEAVDIWHRDCYGWSALGHAVAEGHLATVNVFVTRLPKRDIYNNPAGPNKATGLSIAIREGKEEIVQLFLHHVPSQMACGDLCGDDTHPFHSALQRGDEKLAQLMVDAMEGKEILDFNAKDLHGRLPLHAAIIGGCHRITAFLLPHTDRVDEGDTRGLTPFQYAIESGDHTAMSLLLDYHPINVANTNSAGKCCIMSSIGKISRPLIHRMLRLDSARLEGRDKYQASLLHYSCYDGDFEAVRILLSSRNVDVNETMSSWPPDWKTSWPRPGGLNGLKPITCAMVGSKDVEDKREILQMLLDTERLRFPDPDVQLLQTCSTVRDGLLLWRLIDQGLSVVSPTIPKALSSSTVGEMVTFLVRDQLIAKETIELDSALATQTLEYCLKHITALEPRSAASVLIRNHLLHEAFSSNDMSKLANLLHKGLTLADVIHSSDLNVLRWALATGHFDGNEVHQGKPLFVEACLNYDWSVVYVLLEYGGMLRTDIITDAIEKLINVPTEDASIRRKAIAGYLVGRPYVG